MLKFAVIAFGWAYMILAIWWFFRPKRIRNVFERSFRRKMRWLLVVVTFAVGGVIFGAGRDIGGWVGTLLVVIGIVALLKGLFFLSGKASDKVFDWWAKQPDSVYRAAAVVMFIVGLLAQLLFKAGEAG
jgi:hypothetical protein